MKLTSTSMPQAIADRADSTVPENPLSENKSFTDASQTSQTTEEMHSYSTASSSSSVAASFSSQPARFPLAPVLPGLYLQVFYAHLLFYDYLYILYRFHRQYSIKELVSKSKDCRDR